jgi:4'-phosphopantetheinyl transferase
MKQESREHLNGHIVVWLAQISMSHDSLPSLQGYLDEKDVDRAARFRLPEDRARYVLGRALTRECLARYLNRAPGTIAFIYSGRGRPMLAGDDSIQFSISHTQDWVAFALTSHARVGIDLEYLRPDFNLAEMAVRIFSRTDLQRFQALPGDEKLASFFRAWTRKEAYLKARGEGITDALDQVSVSFGPEEFASLKDSRAPSDAHSWRLQTFPLPVNYAGSLAWDDPEKIVECRLVRFNQSEMILDLPPDW